MVIKPASPDTLISVLALQLLLELTYQGKTDAFPCTHNLHFHLYNFHFNSTDWLHWVPCAFSIYFIFTTFILFRVLVTNLLHNHIHKGTAGCMHSQKIFSNKLNILPGYSTLNTWSWILQTLQICAQNHTPNSHLSEHMRFTLMCVFITVFQQTTATKKVMSPS